MEKKDITLPSEQDTIAAVYQTIKSIIEEARNVSCQAVNFSMVKAYWEVGRVIVEEEQRGKARADYGRYLIKELSKKLSQNLGKGFDISNLKNMRQFYIVFPKGDALRRQLSWTHYRLIMRVDKAEARDFYMVEAINNKWGTRELGKGFSFVARQKRITVENDHFYIQHSCQVPFFPNFFKENWPIQPAKMTISAATIPFLSESIIELEEMEVNFTANLPDEELESIPGDERAAINNHVNALVELIENGI